MGNGDNIRLSTLASPNNTHLADPPASCPVALRLSPYVARPNCRVHLHVGQLGFVGPNGWTLTHDIVTQKLSLSYYHASTLSRTLVISAIAPSSTMFIIAVNLRASVACEDFKGEAPPRVLPCYSAI